MAEPLGDAPQAQLGHALPPETDRRLRTGICMIIVDAIGRLLALSSWAGLNRPTSAGEEFGAGP